MNNDEQAAGIMLGAVALALGVIFLINLIIYIFYCLTLTKALKKVSPPNRAMDPNLVWLLLIPCVGWIWHFFVVINMAKSLDAEFKSRGIPEESNPGRTIGLVACVLTIAAAIPVVGGFFGLAGLVCLAVYWAKIAGYSKKLGA